MCQFQLVVHETMPTVHSVWRACCCRYGGVVERPNIAAQADWYIYDIHALLDALQ
jgi:hypothetical protein